MHEHHPPNHHYKWSFSRSSSIHSIFISDHPQDHHQDKSSSYWIIWPCSCRRPWWPCTGRCCPSPSWRWPDCPPPLACTVCLVMKMLVKIILTILTILIGDSNMNTSYLDSLWGAEGRYQRRPHASPSQLSVCAQYSGPCSGGLQNLKSISIPNNYDIWLRLTDWLTDGIHDVSKKQKAPREAVCFGKNCRIYPRKDFAQPTEREKTAKSLGKVLKNRAQRFFLKTAPLQAFLVTGN